MVFEHMSQGTLEGVTHDLDLVLEWDTMIQLLIDAAQGMTYLHGVAPTPVVHQDLRTSRFWVDKTWRVKVADYVFVSLDGALRGAPCAPSSWMAPEVLVTGGRPSSITIESNVYSFGLIMWEVLTRKKPFGDGAFDPIEMGSKIVDKGLRPVIPSSMSIELRDLITRCWAKDPRSRPTFGQILNVLQEVKAKG
jgi:serine/threonine protein kinase